MTGDQAHIEDAAMMISRSISIGSAFAITVLVGLQRADFAFAQEKDGVHIEAPCDARQSWQEERREILAWLDRYQTVQVVFKDDRIEKIRARVADMSEDELQQWLAQTAEIRKLLDSDDWRETREWYREFLRVQAIYSDEEIERFREKAGEASPRELYEILMDIKRRREGLKWMHNASESQRKSSLAMWEKHQQQLATGRFAPRKAAYHGGYSAYGLRTSTAERSYWRSGYRVPPPLITSREVARGAVRSLFYGGYGWGW